jgi:hypothetical protein
MKAFTENKDNSTMSRKDGDVNENFSFLKEWFTAKLDRGGVMSNLSALCCGYREEIVAIKLQQCLETSWEPCCFPGSAVV